MSEKEIHSMSLAAGFNEMAVNFSIEEHNGKIFIGLERYFGNPDESKPQDDLLYSKYELTSGSIFDARKLIWETAEHFNKMETDKNISIEISDIALYLNNNPNLKLISDRQLETAQKTGYIQGVCESVLAFNNDENKKIMTDATITFLSKKLLSEMNVTKDMAQKFANPETYKALEQSVFAPKHEQQLEQTQTRGWGV
ncbi:MAG: hypothetical protein LBV17_03950 [Treponema sp.]|jgi:hypothetical protein|nr:hypothetical protein [Treponema sp.]